MKKSFLFFLILSLGFVLGAEDGVQIVPENDETVVAFEYENPQNETVSESVIESSEQGSVEESGSKDDVSSENAEISSADENAESEEIAVDVRPDVENVKTPIEEEIARLQELELTDEMGRTEKQKLIDEKRLELDAQKQSLYTKDLRLKISTQVEEIRALQVQLEEAKIQDVTPNEQIAEMEAQKKVLNEKILGVIDLIESQVQQNLEDSNKRKDEILDEINNKELNPDYFTDGIMNPDGRNAISEAVKNENLALEKKDNEDAARIIKTSLPEETQIISSINQIAKAMSATALTENSMLESENLVVRVQDYDAENDAWNVKIDFYFMDNLIYSTVYPVSYKMLTGKNPVKYYADRRQLYYEFQDNVNFYDSLFRQTMPVVQVELVYNVSPETPKNVKVSRHSQARDQFLYPDTDSSYIVAVKKITLTNLTDGKSKKIVSLSPNENKKITYGDSAYHLWTSSDYWALKAKTEELLAAEVKEEKFATTKQKRATLKEKEDKEKEEFKKEQQRQFTEFKSVVSPTSGFDVTFIAGNLFSGETVLLSGSISQKFKITNNFAVGPLFEFGPFNNKSEGTTPLYLSLMAAVTGSITVSRFFTPYAIIGFGAYSTFEKAKPAPFFAAFGESFKNNWGLNLMAGAGVCFLPSRIFKIHTEYTAVYLFHDKKFDNRVSLGMTFGF